LIELAGPKVMPLVLRLIETSSKTKSGLAVRTADQIPSRLYLSGSPGNVASRSFKQAAWQQMAGNTTAAKPFRKIANV
jgi:hypothetical protein